MEKKEDIRVLLVEPMQKPRLVTVEHTLENLQKLVDGYIQAVYPWEDPVAVICDEDGIANGKPLNRLLVDEEDKPYDILKGTFFICGLGGEEDFISISDELAEKYTQKFQWPELFGRTKEGRLIWTTTQPDVDIVRVIG